MINASALTNPADLIRLERELDVRLRRVALKVTDRAALQVKNNLRQEFSAAGLGKLGFAIGSGSDKNKNGVVKELGGGRWSASGWIFIRSQSKRTVGAIISYTENAIIQPRRGRYLWIATDEIHRMAGVPLPNTGGGKGRANVRLEPRFWDRTYGRRLGPLVPIKSKNGTPLLVIKNMTVSASGKKGTLKDRTKSGRVRKGQVAQDITVAFYGIPNTSRAARVFPRSTAQRVINEMPNKMAIDLNVSIK